MRRRRNTALWFSQRIADHESLSVTLRRFSVCVYTIHTHTHTCIHACMHAYIQTNMHVNIHTYKHTYIQIYIHTYIYTYQHTYQPDQDDMPTTAAVLSGAGTSCPCALLCSSDEQCRILLSVTPRAESSSSAWDLLRIYLATRNTVSTPSESQDLPSVRYTHCPTNPQRSEHTLPPGCVPLH